VPLAGVIFDFDGVLANSEPLHLRAFQDVLAGRGITLSDSAYFDRYLGFDDLGVFRAVAEQHGWSWEAHTLAELLEAKGARFDALASQGEALFPGAADCVRRLAAEVPIAIASGALRPEIETMLSTTGLRRHFTAIVASGDTERSKPAPDPYLKAVELLRPFVETEPGGAGCFVAIEDSHWGIDSAVAAGLRCIGVAQTYPPDRLTGAHLVVPTIEDVRIDTARRVCRGA